MQFMSHRVSESNLSRRLSRNQYLGSRGATIRRQSVARFSMFIGNSRAGIGLSGETNGADGDLELWELMKLTSFDRWLFISIISNMTLVSYI